MTLLINILAIWFALNIAIALVLYFKPFPAATLRRARTADLPDRGFSASSWS